MDIQLGIFNSLCDTKSLEKNDKPNKVEDAFANLRTDEKDDKKTFYQRASPGLRLTLVRQ